MTALAGEAHDGLRQRARTGRSTSRARDVRRRLRLAHAGGPVRRHHDGGYDCFYSGGSWLTEGYAVAWASDHPLGPGPNRPASDRLLATVPGHVRGPGHNSIVTTTAARRDRLPRLGRGHYQTHDVHRSGGVAGRRSAHPGSELEGPTTAGMTDPTSLDEIRERHPRPQMTRPDWTDLNGSMAIRLRRLRHRDGPTLVRARRRLRPDDHRSVPAGVPGQRHRGPRLPSRRLVPADVLGSAPFAWMALLLLHFGAVDYRACGLGQRPPGRHPRGRAHAVLRRRDSRPGRRRARTCWTVRAEDPPADLDPAAGQAGLAGASAQHLLRADHGHLAAGLAGNRSRRPTSPRCAGPPTCCGGRCAFGWFSTDRYRRGCSWVWRCSSTATR